jgi:ubiquinone/menaquinone biosynthesis C-methylase UbiE
VLAWEQERYDQVVADIFGFNALQMGMTQCDFLRANRMPFRQRCDPDGPAEVRTHFEHLPYATSSLDLVVMPHVLEFSPDPHQILREVERVLVPEGIVYISDYWLQDDDRNRTRYDEFRKKYGIYGVFELPEGAVVRHHGKEWIASLLVDFRQVDMFDIETTTMNGNIASGFQYIGRKKG